MIKAFHQVWGKSVKELLREGVLYPALNHVDPYWIQTSCNEDIHALISEMHQANRAVFDDAVRRLQAMVEHEANMVDQFQEEEGVKGESTHSNLTCIDILANDFDKIFMSVFNWITPRPAPGGFVFDADFLIKEGAVVRSGDLLEHYRDGLKEVLASSLRPEDYEEAFRETIDAVLKKHEWSGAAARKLLDRTEKKQMARVKKGGKGEVELVFDGPIPLEWAIEAWQDGKKIKG